MVPELSLHSAHTRPILGQNSANTRPTCGQHGVGTKSIQGQHDHTAGLILNSSGGGGGGGREEGRPHWADGRCARASGFNGQDVGEPISTLKQS